MFKLKSNVTANDIAMALSLSSTGDGQLIIDNVAPLGDANETSLSFNKKSDNDRASGCIIARGNDGGALTIQSSDPRLDFIRAIAWLDKNIGFAEHLQPAIVHETATVGANVYLGKNVKIGANTVIEPNVVILDNTSIGESCLIRANASIGSDGFGFERMSDRTPIRFVHLGGVDIGNDVEIGSNTCISKGTLGNTVIEDGVKIDNLVHVAHNCVLRKGAFIIACAELSGGVEVGENAWVAPNAAVREQIKIGANAVVGLSAVVTKPVADNTVVAGNPAKVLNR